jgi:hypothetical protein
VGYNDLIYATNAAWKPVGGSDTGGDTGHGTTQNNHYMLPDTANALAATTAVWAQQTGNCMICINGAALQYGGKFDIKAIVPYTGTSYTPIPGYGSYRPWACPHALHDSRICRRHQYVRPRGLPVSGRRNQIS